MDDYGDNWPVDPTKKGFIGTCFICGDHVAVNDLVMVNHNKQTWYVCDCCFAVMFHAGYTTLEIGKELERVTKNRKTEPLELRDMHRKHQKRITLEEMADFMYWLYKDGSGIVEKIK